MSVDPARIGKVDRVFESSKLLGAPLGFWFPSVCERGRLREPIQSKTKFTEGFSVSSVRGCGYTVRGNSLDLTGRLRERDGEDLDPPPTTATFPSSCLLSVLSPNTGTLQAAGCPGPAFSVASARP